SPGGKPVEEARPSKVAAHRSGVARMTILQTLSPRSLAAPESGIVELVNYARGREGLIPLWVGEGDLPTPDFISEAAIRALSAGETFYTWQRGIPELRQALSRYYARHFG